MCMISDSVAKIATERLEEMGFKVTFGKNVSNSCPNQVQSSPIEDRIEDLHDAFKDQTVQGILTVIGGFNSDQIISKIDYDLIRSNPKVFCGYSDITTLSNAFLAKAGLVTFSGPHWSSFGMELGLEYTIQEFTGRLMKSKPDEWETIQPSLRWRDDPWYMDQKMVNVFDNEGHQIIRQGTGEGLIIGGNLITTCHLAGTPYLLIPESFILFAEDTFEETMVNFDQQLQHLLLIPGFKEGLKGIVIGRFQMGSNMNAEKISKIISIKSEIASNIPIIYGCDFGHTSPHTVVPIGGFCRLQLSNTTKKIEVSW
ncbi:muramoyltetrapeptide carboxypeptidase [Globomyces pollinis-pini]|nr:muramoyltetrapeptide carboxypeptidase [Globomyces pollinis-pini]